MSLVMEDSGCSVVTCGKYYISTSNAHVVSLRRNRCHLPRIRPCSLWASKTEVHRDFLRKKRKKFLKWSPKREELLRPLIALCNHCSSPKHKQKNKNMYWFVILFCNTILVQKFVLLYPCKNNEETPQHLWKTENPKIPFVSTGEEQKGLVPTLGTGFRDLWPGGCTGSLTQKGPAMVFNAFYLPYWISLQVGLCFAPMI